MPLAFVLLGALGVLALVALRPTPTVRTGCGGSPPYYERATGLPPTPCAVGAVSAIVDCEAIPPLAAVGPAFSCPSPNYACVTAADGARACGDVVG